MPRYYFGLADGTTVIEDPEGTELPGLDAAREEVVASMRELRQPRISGKRSWAGWVMQVTNQGGVILFKRSFAKRAGRATLQTDPG